MARKLTPEAADSAFRLALRLLPEQIDEAPPQLFQALADRLSPEHALMLSRFILDRVWDNPETKGLALQIERGMRALLGNPRSEDAGASIRGAQQALRAFEGNVKPLAGALAALSGRLPAEKAIDFLQEIASKMRQTPDTDDGSPLAEVAQGLARRLTEREHAESASTSILDVLRESKACPSDCAIGHTGPDQRDLV